MHKEDYGFLMKGSNLPRRASGTVVKRAMKTTIKVQKRRKTMVTMVVRVKTMEGRGPLNLPNLQIQLPQNLLIKKMKKIMKMKREIRVEMVREKKGGMEEGREDRKKRKKVEDREKKVETLRTVSRLALPRGLSRHGE
jgi:hypothetical protein